MILAQAAVGGLGFWQVMEHLGLLAAILGGLAAVAMARRKREVRKIEPQPLEIDGEVRVVPKGRRYNAETCDGRHKTLDDRIATLEGYTKNEVGRIHDKIDLVERRADDNLKQSITDLRETIRKLPLEIVDLLRKTGQMTDHKSQHYD
jgi:hypothetical protein